MMLMKSCNITTHDSRYAWQSSKQTPMDTML